MARKHHDGGAHGPKQANKIDILARVKVLWGRVKVLKASVKVLMGMVKVLMGRVKVLKAFGKLASWPHGLMVSVSTTDQWQDVLCTREAA